VPKTQSPRTADRKPDPDVEREPQPAPRAEPRKKKVAAAPGNRAAAEAESVRGDKSLRAFDPKGAEAAFTAALQLDPTLPSAHRGMGMVYVLLGRNNEAKAEYSRYLQLAPDAPDKEQIARLLAR
jgi:Tfp pilus assembly protein PilF